MAKAINCNKTCGKYEECEKLGNKDGFTIGERCPDYVEKDQCSNCLYGQDAKTSFAKKSIECRRYPPAQEAGVQQPDNSPFPIVAVDGWCGEYSKGANYGKEKE